MSRAPRAAAVLGVVALLSASVTGCGRSSDARGEKDADRGTPAADLSTCKADASAAPTPYKGFPASWPFPPDTVVFHAEDRGSDGTIVTGTSSAPFTTVLATMNTKVVHAGFRIEKGETEDHDAEAEWKGNGFRGRWAIRASATCTGETVIQVLSAAD